MAKNWADRRIETDWGSWPDKLGRDYGSGLQVIQAVFILGLSKLTLARALLRNLKGPVTSNYLFKLYRQKGDRRTNRSWEPPQSGIFESHEIYTKCILFLFYFVGFFFFKFYVFLTCLSKFRSTRILSTLMTSFTDLSVIADVLC